MTARLRHHAPAAAAFAASLALSAAVLARRPLVNNDGIFYLLAADAFTRDGFAVAGATYGWPFHPILVALAASLLGVSAETAARAVGALLLALACAAFVAVVRALDGGRRAGPGRVAVPPLGTRGLAGDVDPPGDSGAG